LVDDCQILVNEIHLEFGGNELHDGDSLAQHDIKYGSVITVCTGGRSP
jgi:hypothetical protein